jgi:hypothetical protein
VAESAAKAEDDAMLNKIIMIGMIRDDTGSSFELIVETTVNIGCFII